jgi:branched-chain amino acid transport system permease protein
MIVEIIANGLIVGSVYALVALGLTMVFGVLEVPDFNQGAIFMLGAFTVYFMVSRWGYPYFVAIAVAMIVCGLIGVIVNELVYARLMNSPHTFLLIAALGLFLVFENGALWLWGSSARSVDTMFTGQTFEVLGILLTVERVLAFGVTVVAIVLLQVFLKMTRFGKAMRATAEDRPVATLMGVNIRQIERVTVLIASGLSGLAGGLLAPLLFVFPAMGTEIILKAFVIVVLGGLGSIPGAIAGGWILGVSEAMGSFYVGSAWKSSIAFMVLIAVLLVRPRGLFNTAKQKI